jgi:hypothetical protein
MLQMIGKGAGDEKREADADISGLDCNHHRKGYEDRAVAERCGEFRHGVLYNLKRAYVPLP